MATRAIIQKEKHTIMGTKILAVIILILLTFCSFNAGAVDLPIDIDVIGQDGGSGEAYTANVNIELLTPRAQEMTQAIVESNLQKREELVSSLVLSTNEDKVLNYNEQVLSYTANSSLFSQPSDYSGYRIPTEDSSISLWVLILLLIASTISGFVLARVLLQRREDKEIVY